MRIFVKAKPNSNQEKIKEIKSINSTEKYFIISIKESPISGKANQAILQVLSNYFKIPISRIKIISGLKSKQKIIEIEE